MKMFKRVNRKLPLKCQTQKSMKFKSKVPKTHKPLINFPSNFPENSICNH